MSTVNAIGLSSYSFYDNSYIVINYLLSNVFILYRTLQKLSERTYTEFNCVFSCNENARVVTIWTEISAVTESAYFHCVVIFCWSSEIMDCNYYVVYIWQYCSVYARGVCHWCHLLLLFINNFKNRGCYFPNANYISLGLSPFSDWCIKLTF